MLRNVVGIVSGGASGLGAASVAHIIRHGGRALVADLPRTHDNYLRLAAEAGAEASHHGSNSNSDPHAPIIAFAPVDVTDEESIKKALDVVEETFGESVNVCVNCAGVAPARKTLSRNKDGSENLSIMPLETFTATLEVNAVGTFNMCRLTAERMAMRKPDQGGLRGCIVNTASIAAFEGQTGQVAYAASKGAVVGMCLPLARDLAPFGIRVMTIAPGLFKTPLLDGLPEKVQIDLGKTVPCPNRLGYPDEYGKLVMSILTNPMLNGEVIRLDGALRMPP